MTKINLTHLIFFIYKHLTSYTPFNKSEEEYLKQIIKFIKTNKDCLDKKYSKGHIIGSAYIVDQNFEQILLNHHKTLDCWLNIGGHTDNDPNIFNVALLREAYEETGLESLKFIKEQCGIFDIDIHSIPDKQNKYP